MKRLVEGGSNSLAFVASRVKFMGHLYLLGTVVFTVLGQLIIKWRIVQYGAMPEKSVDKAYFFLKAFLDPFIIVGLLSAFVASIFWMAAMTKYDVSYAYPFITAGLTVITVFMAILVLGETITINKISGLTLVVLGVVVLGLSK